MRDHIERFADLVERAQVERFVKEYPNLAPPTVRVTYRRKFAYVDRMQGSSGSGMYMVELTNGVIHDIRGYGQVHPFRTFGTVQDAGSGTYNWSGYSAVRVR